MPHLPHFKNKELLVQALTHKSYTLIQNKSPHNERLEFLGDSILNTSIALLLYKKYPSHTEGDLSKMRALLVSEKALFHKALEYSLDNKIKVQPKNQKLNQNSRILSSALEAIIAAYYMEVGFSKTCRWIESMYKKDFTKNLATQSEDYKSLLQIYFQKKHTQTPLYEVYQDDKTSSNRKKFFIRVLFQNQILGYGVGLSKKEAEQKAAKQAWENIVQKNET